MIRVILQSEHQLDLEPVGRETHLFQLGAQLLHGQRARRRHFLARLENRDSRAVGGEGPWSAVASTTVEPMDHARRLLPTNFFKYAPASQEETRPQETAHSKHVHTNANTTRVQKNAHLQQVEMQKQDQVLDEMHHIVDRIKLMGTTMNDELKIQADMVQDLESQADKAENSMQAMNSKLIQLVHKKDFKGKCAIFALSMFLIFLLTLVLE